MTAEALFNEGSKKDSAIAVLDKCEKIASSFKNA